MAGEGERQLEAGVLLTNIGGWWEVEKDKVSNVQLHHQKS